jgi:two-component system, LytTR family, response regulator
MTFTCIIIEDEPLARNLLSQYVGKISTLQLLKTFSNPLEALDFLRENTVDILFLDVQMPELTGISFLKILKNKPVVILTTAYSEYAIEGYELDVTDYLLKPITFERFLKAVEKATQRITSTQPTNTHNLTENTSEKPVTTEGGNAPSFIFLKDGTKLVKVNLSDIMYVEGLKDYVIIHTPQKKITTLQRLKILEEQLPESQFIRIHNSYIVALTWIDVIHKDRVQIGKMMIPISDTYRKAFKEYIERHNIKFE